MIVSLIPDWKIVLKKAWSVRFTIASAVFSALEMIVPMIQPGEVQRGLFAGVAFLISIGATGVRVLAQKEVPNAQTNPNSVK